MKLHNSVTRQVAINNFYTLEERFNKIHNNKYNYDKSVFINTKTKITITCPIHGDFEQTVGNHLSGKGCLQCSGKALKTTEQFIRDAMLYHKDKYDYSKSIYKSAKVKLEIICKEHGSFWMPPNAHLGHYKQGCPTCGQIYQAETQRDTITSFIQKAISTHGNLYDYSKVNYIESSKAVIIICPVHGEFEQTPNSHIQGSGCQKCTKTGFNSGKPAYLYSFQIGEVYKIGITNRTVKDRYNSVDYGNISNIQELLFEDGASAQLLEQQLKISNKEFKYSGPTPFTDGTGITECFIKQIDILDIAMQ